MYRIFGFLTHTFYILIIFQLPRQFEIHLIANSCQVAIKKLKTMPIKHCYDFEVNENKSHEEK